MTPARLMDERDKDRGRQPALRVVAGGATPARREEDALVAAFLVGDDEAFGELVRRNEPLVLSLVRRYARTPDDARDLAQRTFLRAFEAARRALRRGPLAVRGREAVPFRRWLVRVALNLAKNHARDEARRGTPVSLEAAGDLAASPGPSAASGAAGLPPGAGTLATAAGGPSPGAPPDVLARAEQAAAVRRAVLLLPRRQREVLTLRIDAELPFAEIALALGITENAAKVSFHHATRRLRALLAAPAGEDRP